MKNIKIKNKKDRYESYDQFLFFFFFLKKENRQLIR